MEFAGLLTRLAKEPVTVNLSNSSDDLQSSNVTLTADFFAGVVRYMTKDASYHPILPLLIHRAYQENDWQGFAQFISNNG